MNILVGYGYYPYTTGTYFESSAAKKHRCIYVGTPWGARPGFAPDVDLVPLVKELETKPDLYLYIDSGHAPHHPRGLEKVDFPTACYLIDVHLGMKLRVKQAAFFDYVFVVQKDYVSDMAKTLGHNRVYWLPLACDPEIHKKLDLPRVYDVGFVGGIGGNYTERRAMLESLAQTYKMNDFCRPYNREEIARIYSQSKIVFNKSILNEVNMRVFESTSCGSMLLTDRIGNGQDELFQDRCHIVTYSDKAEMLQLVEYYLHNDAEREGIAKAGHQLAITKHTYDARLNQIIETIFDSGKPCLEAPIRKQPEPGARLDYAEMYSMLRLVDAAMDELTTLRKLGKGRTLAIKQVLYALLRRAKHG